MRVSVTKGQIPVTASDEKEGLKEKSRGRARSYTEENMEEEREEEEKGVVEEEEQEEDGYVENDLKKEK